jgi:hypothetical protein
MMYVATHPANPNPSHHPLQIKFVKLRINELKQNIKSAIKREMTNNFRGDMVSMFLNIASRTNVRAKTPHAAMILTRKAQTACDISVNGINLPC